MIIRRLDSVLCPVYTRRHKANADLLPLDRLHNGREEEDVEPESQNFPSICKYRFQSNFKIIQIEVNLKWKHWSLESLFRFPRRKKRKCDTRPSRRSSTWSSTRTSSRRTWKRRASPCWTRTATHLRLRRISSFLLTFCVYNNNILFSLFIKHLIKPFCARLPFLSPCVG